MKSPSLFLFFLVFFFINPGFIKGQYIFVRHLNLEDILPSNSVNAIAKDSNETIWLGTDLGLFSYNGFGFESRPLYSPTDSQYLREIFRLIIDPSKNVYLGFLNNGFGELASDGQFRHYKYLPGSKTGLLNNSIDHLEDLGDQVLLIFEKNGFALFDKKRKTFEHYLPSRLLPEFSRLDRFNFLYTSQRDPFDENRVWIAGRTGLFSWDNAKKKLRFFPPDPKAMEYSPVRTLHITTEGKIYMGTWLTGMLIFDIKKNRWEPSITSAGGFDLRIISYVGRKSDTELWVNTFRNGLCTYQPATGEFHLSLPVERGPAFAQNPDRRLDEEVINILALGDGSKLLLKTAEKGLAFIYDEPRHFVKTETGVAMHRVIPVEGDSLLLITNEARFFISPGTFATTDEKKIAPFLEDGGFRDGFCDSADKCFIVGWKGIYQYHPSKREALHVSIPFLDSLVRAGISINTGYLVPQSGQIWLGTSRGLFILENSSDKQGKWVSIRDSLLHEPITWNGFNDITSTPDGKVWFLGDSGFGYSEDGGKTFLLYRNENLGKAGAGIADFTSIEYDDQGRLWIGNNGERLGYIFYDLPHPQPLILLDTKPGQPVVRNARYLTRDRNGNIWGIEKRGLFRLKAADKGLRFFGREYGLPPGSLFTLDTLPGGYMYVGSANSFFRFHPDSLRTDCTTPDLFIHRVILLGKEKTDTLAAPNALKSAWRQNSFHVELGTRSFWFAAQAGYQYKLEGFHPEWIQGGDPAFTLWNIPPGNYSLLVRPFSSSGHFPENTLLVLPLTVRPPVWGRLWLQILSALVFAAVIAAGVLYSQRTRHQKALLGKRMAELEMTALRAQMNPHFIFNALNSIKWFVVQGDREKTVEYLDRFSLLIRKVLDYSRQEMIPLAWELEIISLMLSIEQTRFRNKFAYNIQVDERVDTEFFRVPPLLLQPYVENAIWHGLLHKTEGDCKLEVRIEEIPDGIRCIVEDNGIGREKARQKKTRSLPITRSYGIKISRERIEQLAQLSYQRAELHIEDLTDAEGRAAGTRVLLVFCP